MAIPTFSNWRDYFMNHPNTDAGNENISEFTAALSVELEDFERVEALVEEIDTVILAADADGQILILHSPKRFGGTHSRATGKIVGLMGLGVDAQRIIVKKYTAVLACKFKTPTFGAIHRCALGTDIEGLRSSSSVTFEGAAIFIPAPWLRDVILMADTRDPIEIILAALPAQAQFDIDQETPTEGASADASDAVAHVDDFIMWAHGVFSGKIPETRYSLDPDDEELKTFAVTRHQDCLLSADTGIGTAAGTLRADSGTVLAQLAAQMSQQNDHMGQFNVLHQQQLERQKEKDDNKANRKKDLHPSIINMLKMASATDSDTTPLDITPSCATFLDCKTMGLADVELQEQFAHLKLRGVGFAQGTAQALYSGSFLYYQECTPSNFTGFGFYQQNPHKGDLRERAILLHIMSKEGRGKSWDEVRSSMKQAVRTPMSVQELLTQLSYLRGASCIFFGTGSLISDRISSLESAIENHKLSFELQTSNDNSFPTKFLYAIDTKVQRWLLQCKEARARDEVNDRIIEFDHLVNMVLDQMFHMQLPPCFHVPTDTPEHVAGGPNKRLKISAGHPSPESAPRSMVTNNSQFDAFKLKDGEDWKTFCGASVNDRPMWNDQCRMCARWHIKGNCFSDCPHAASHVPHEKVSTEKERSFQKYVKKVRGD